MFGNLSSVLGSFANLTHTVTAAFGAFKLQRKVNVTVSDGKTTSKRKYLATEQYTAYGNVDVSIGLTLNDTRGFNKTMVDENGMLTPDIYVSKLRNYGAINRESLIDITADARSWIRDDSQVALLTSLLSTIYTLKFKESRQSVTPMDYTDGHISAKLLAVMDLPINAGEWRADHELTARTWDPRVMTAAPEHPVINVSGMDRSEVAILLQHISGRIKTTDLAFDITVPALADAIRVFGVADVDDKKAPDGTTSAKVMRVLNKYVIANRLYGAFEVALGIYHQTALTPVPDTAEGLIWLKRKKQIILPRFDAMRGLFSVILLEDGYGISANVTHTWKWWRDAGLSSAATAAPYNAISLWGRYFVEGGFYHKDADVYKLGSFEFAHAPGSAYYAYASLLTGGDVYCAVPPTYGLSYAPWDEDFDYSIPVTVQDLSMTGYDVEVLAGQAHLKIKNIPQPCTATVVLGRCARDGAFSALSEHFTIPIARADDAWVVPNVDKAWGFGMVTRWLGYNTVMRYNGTQRIANWASNASSIAVRPFQVRGRDIKTVEIISVAERQRVFDLLPSMGNVDTEWSVDVDVTDRFSITGMSGHMVAVDGAFHSKLGKDAPIITANVESTMFMPLIIRAVRPNDPVMAGFQVVYEATGPNPPEPVATSRQPEQPPDDPLPGAGGGAIE